jgi:hypothetical protein
MLGTLAFQLSLSFHSLSSQHGFTGKKLAIADAIGVAVRRRTRDRRRRCCILKRSA